MKNDKATEIFFEVLQYGDAIREHIERDDYVILCVGDVSDCNCLSVTAPFGYRYFKSIRRILRVHGGRIRQAETALLKAQLTRSGGFDD